MTKENLFRKAIANRQPTLVEPPDTAEDVSHQIADVSSSEVPQPTPKIEPVAQVDPPVVKKRGRPATGKRSDDAWIGRTFYIQRETDLDTQTELLNLKRKGIEIDKSELVDKLLAAWVKWQKGENLDFLLSEISPSQKGEKS